MDIRSEPADIAVVDGRLVLIVAADVAGLIAVLIEQALGARYRLGKTPIPAAHDVLRAARAAHALTALAVPCPEPFLAADTRSGSVWITTKQAARLLHIGERAVVKRIAAGTLTGRKVGGRWQVRPDTETTQP